MDCVNAYKVRPYLQHKLGILKLKHFPGQVMFADILTKQITGP